MTARRIFLTSFSALPLPLFVFLILLAVRAHSGTAAGEARLESDLALLRPPGAATKAKRDHLILSAGALKKIAKRHAYYRRYGYQTEASSYVGRYRPSGR